MVLKMNDIKTIVNKKIKQFSNKKYLEGYIKNEYLTDDGDADIIMILKNKEDLFDSRTSGNQLELRKDFYDYVDDKTSILDNNIQINLHIKGLNITDREKGRGEGFYPLEKVDGYRFRSGICTGRRVSPYKLPYDPCHKNRR